MTRSVRRNFLLILLLCASGLSVALFTQHVLGMRPCAWCVLQRLILLLIAAVVLIGVLFSGTGRLVSRLTSATMAALGLGGGIAAWHQFTVAATQFSCSQTFAERVMTGFGLDATIPWLFGIKATCMDARADLFGIDYALWSLALFFTLAVLSVITLIATFKD